MRPVLRARALRRKTRQIIRGYRLLRKGPDPHLVSRLNCELTLLDLEVQEHKLPAFLLGPEVRRAEIAARQLFLSRLAGSRLNSEILRSIADREHKVAAPVPGTWITKLEQFGLRVEVRKCQGLFALFVLTMLARGIARFLMILTAQAEETTHLQTGCRYAQFCDLAAKNLPARTARPRYDIVSWYLGWDGRVEHLCEVRHTVRGQPNRDLDGVAVMYSRRNLPSLAGVRTRVRYAMWGARAIAWCSWQALRGQWLCAVLLEDAALAQQVHCLQPGSLAAEYLFNCSGIIRRPFWTYAAERMGSTVTLYFYSAGLRSCFNGTRPHYETGLQSMTWARILVFSTHQQEYLAAATDARVPVTLVPPINFSDVDIDLPATERRCIAVFDVSPARMSYRAPLAPDDDYRVVSVGIRFLEDIYASVLSHGYTMMWKRKRPAHAIYQTGYVRFAQAFSQRPGVIEVPPDVAAARVIRNCVAVISMPFTSTSVLGDLAGVPSVFYDPTGAVPDIDPAALGVRVVSGTRALDRWLDALPDLSAVAGSRPLAHTTTLAFGE